MDEYRRFKIQAQIGAGGQEKKQICKNVAIVLVNDGLVKITHFPHFHEKWKMAARRRG